MRICPDCGEVYYKDHYCPQSPHNKVFERAKELRKQGIVLTAGGEEVPIEEYKERYGQD